MQEFAKPNLQAETVANKIVNNRCCVFGIPESILADGGKQYQSKLLDLVYEYLDIRGLKTTPFNPRCNGLSEKSVQTSKNMIKAHVNDEQSDWDEQLEKFTYVYITSVQETTKQTPFEMMFGRKPKLPIDIALASVEIPQETNVEEQNQSNQNSGEATILNDNEKIKIPEEAQNYLNKLRRKIEESHSKAALNRNIPMERHKLFYDRKIKRFSYNIGDYVLCDHPRLKKGIARGLAKKYYGPFVVRSKKNNGVDLLIQRVGKKRGKLYQIHQNRLKTYHKYDRIDDNDNNSSSEEEAETHKRCYNKRCPKIPRWDKSKQTKSNKTKKDTESSSSQTSSENESKSTQNGSPMDENETELIENDQMQTYSESSIPDRPKEERSKSYNLRKRDKRNHTNKREQKEKREKKNKTITDGAQRELAQRVRKPPDRLNYK